MSRLEDLEKFMNSLTDEELQEVIDLSRTNRSTSSARNKVKKTKTITSKLFDKLGNDPEKLQELLDSLEGGNN